MHHTAKQRPADHPRSLALPFCGISAVARDVVQRQPGHSMHPSQGSQSCAALFRLSCLVFRLSRTVLFCHPSVLHCLSSFVLQCTRRCLQMILGEDEPGSEERSRHARRPAVLIELALHRRKTPYNAHTSTNLRSKP